MTYLNKDVTAEYRAERDRIRAGLTFERTNNVTGLAPPGQRRPGGVSPADRDLLGRFSRLDGRSGHRLLGPGRDAAERVFNFVLKNSTPNFALELDGQFTNDQVLNDLKSGKLQIEVAKWGGGTNASGETLALLLNCYDRPDVPVLMPTSQDRQCLVKVARVGEQGCTDGSTGDPRQRGMEASARCGRGYCRDGSHFAQETRTGSSG
jgi:hypothetical protein